MKVKRLISIFACAFLMAGGALLAVKNAPGYQEAKADDTFAFTLGKTNAKGGIYIRSASSNSLPYDNSWNKRFYPKAASSIKINGVDAATRIYPGDVTNSQSFIKYDDLKYYLDIGSLTGSIGVGDVLTFGGSWGGNYNETEYSFTFAEMSIVWDGTIWKSYVDESDFETYDVITLRDAGIFEFEQEALNTEDSNVPFNVWKPSAGNTNYNFEFSFELQTYVSSTLHEFCLRLGSNANWSSGHYLQFNIYDNEMTLSEYEGDNVVWTHGERIGGVDFHETTSIITIGNIRLKSGTEQVSYIKVNDVYKVYDLHPVAGSIDFKGHIGFYHNASDCSIRNAWAEDYYNPQAQETTTGETTGSAPNFLYFGLTTTNDAPYDGDWNKRYCPDDKMNLLINGQPFYGYKNKAIIKYTANYYALNLADYGYNALVNDGDVVTIRGRYRGLFDGVIYSLNCV